MFSNNNKSSHIASFVKKTNKSKVNFEIIEYILGNKFFTL